MTVNQPRMLKKIGLDPFVLALLGMIVLARLFPGPGAQEGPWSLDRLASYGVSGIFFLYGLRLSVVELAGGLKRWRLHLLVQLSCFLFFPLLVLLCKPLFVGSSWEVLWMGSFFLAALPSTVSSSVVMVSIAGGNIPAAIFNASISSLLGVFITPLWMQGLVRAQPGGHELGPIVLKLVLQVLVPVIVGMLLHRWGGGFAKRHKRVLKLFDQTVILVIVYTAFSVAFEKKLFAGLTAGMLAGLLLAMTGLFWTILLFIRTVCRWLHFDRADTITAIFCGSKKSLVHGTVLSKLLFAGNPQVAVLLLPLMLYHALQLLMASILAGKWNREANKQTV